jgi:hypothetical protein
MTNSLQENLVRTATDLGLNAHIVHRRDRQKRSNCFWLAFFKGRVTSAPACDELTYIIRKEKERLNKVINKIVI